MFQNGSESGPFANTQAFRCKTGLYLVEECSEYFDLDTATVQGGYERLVGLNMLCLVSYLEKDVGQEFQVRGRRSDLFWCLFDGFPEVMELLETFGQLDGEGNYSYTARGGRQAFHCGSR